MTIRKALIFYIAAVVIAIIAAWLLAYFAAWWVGMALMTVVVADHIRYTAKKIRRGG